MRPWAARDLETVAVPYLPRKYEELAKAEIAAGERRITTPTVLVERVKVAGLDTAQSSVLLRNLEETPSSGAGIER